MSTMYTFYSWTKNRFVVNFDFDYDDVSFRPIFYKGKYPDKNCIMFDTYGDAEEFMTFINAISTFDFVADYDIQIQEVILK